MGDVDAVEGDTASRGWQKFGQQVEKRGLACAVGADKCMDMSTLDLQVHIVHGYEPLELFTEAARFQNELN